MNLEDLAIGDVVYARVCGYDLLAEIIAIDKNKVPDLLTLIDRTSPLGGSMTMPALRNLGYNLPDDLPLFKLLQHKVFLVHHREVISTTIYHW